MRPGHLREPGDDLGAWDGWQRVPHLVAMGLEVVNSGDKRSKNIEDRVTPFTSTVTACRSTNRIKDEIVLRCKKSFNCATSAPKSRCEWSLQGTVLLLMFVVLVLYVFFQCLQPNTTCHTTSPEGGLIALCSTKATLLQHAPMSLPCCIGMLSGVPAFPRGKLWHDAGFSLAVSFFRVTLDEANMMFLALVQWSHNRFEHYILYKAFCICAVFFPYHALSWAKQNQVPSWAPAPLPSPKPKTPQVPMVRAASTPMTSPRCRRPRIRPSRLGLAHLGCLSSSRLHWDIYSILYTDIYSTPEKWYTIVYARLYIYNISSCI